MGRLITEEDAVSEVLRDYNHRQVRVELESATVYMVLTGYFRAWTDYDASVFYTLAPRGAMPNNSIKFLREAVVSVMLEDALMPTTFMIQV